MQTEKNKKESKHDRVKLVVDRFTSVADWEDRYRLLIKGGKNLSPLEKSDQVSKYEIKGCQSKVWLKPALVEGKVILKADSDAILVKGIISLLIEVYSGLKPSEILSTSTGFLEEIGITDHLSLNRTNGLRAMIKQIQTYASLFNALIDKGVVNADI